MDNCTPYCIYLHTTNIRVTGVVYSNVSGRWYAQMYNNLKLYNMPAIAMFLVTAITFVVCYDELKQIWKNRK